MNLCIQNSSGHILAASGAWVLAHDDEQKRRFKAVLCAKHKTYSQIKEQRKKSELKSTNKSEDNNENTIVKVDILDQHFLVLFCFIAC